MMVYANKTVPILFFCFFIALLTLPVVSFAQPDFTGDIVHCDFCEFCDLIILAERIVQFLVFFAIVVAILVIVHAGFLFMVGGGSDTNRTRAKRILWTALLGLILTLAAWLIIDVVMTTFLSGNIRGVLGSWADLPGC